MSSWILRNLCQLNPNALSDFCLSYIHEIVENREMTRNEMKCNKGPWLDSKSTVGHGGHLKPRGHRGSQLNPTVNRVSSKTTRLKSLLLFLCIPTRISSNCAKLSGLHGFLAPGS